MTTLHLTPAPGTTVTRCCGREVARLQWDHRTTTMADKVTCRPAPTPAQLLDFETRWGPNHTGRKDEAIRADLHVTPARYYVLLLRAARSPEGVVLAPALCRRLVDRADAAIAGRPLLRKATR